MDLTNMKHFAHSKNEEPPENWQLLEDHLKNVAEEARRFAEPFGGGEWAYLAGLWHDLGKYSKEFQAYLRGKVIEDFHSAEMRGKVDHTSAGAQFAIEQDSILGHLLAYVISGHHSGLLDALNDHACLEKRLKKEIASWKHGLSYLPKLRIPKLPLFLRKALSGNEKEAAFRFSFFVRMIFSCLVDADFLDTARFLNPEIESERPVWPPNILKQIEDCLDAYVGKKFAGEDSDIAKTRAEIRRSCLTAAEKYPGLFSLTVPTGGGKTLSSLAFALKHARYHGLNRVIYVLPFTSIIEQNVNVFREVVYPLKMKGLPDPVIEHHSTIDEETLTGRLAAENWDAPIVVTTTVQFYESLFSNKPSRCRKLHNLIRSVIILDEAQKLPVDFLQPCLRSLKELTDPPYGSTVVLCTATQPAIHRRDDFPVGLNGVREIIPNPKDLYNVLKRVSVKDLGKLSDNDLIEKISSHRQVLCIVNTRNHARDLFYRCRERKGVFHLSAAMCPAHRSYVLNKVKKVLHHGDPCCLISTQVVEAGIDLDFPVVFRSLAGLDSIAQAAGRCNRNGRIPMGTTYLFRSEHKEKELFIKDTKNAASQLIGSKESESLYNDILSLDAIEHYFRLYYWTQQGRWDQYNILTQLKLVKNPKIPFLFNFESISSHFKIINMEGKLVFIPWGNEGKELIERIKVFKEYVPCSLMRLLQRFGVQITNSSFRQLRNLFQNLGNSVYYLPFLEKYYDPEVGFCHNNVPLDPDSLLV